MGWWRFSLVREGNAPYLIHTIKPFNITVSYSTCSSARCELIRLPTSRGTVLLVRRGKGSFQLLTLLDQNAVIKISGYWLDWWENSKWCWFPGTRSVFDILAAEHLDSPLLLRCILVEHRLLLEFVVEPKTSVVGRCLSLSLYIYRISHDDVTSRSVELDARRHPSVIYHPDCAMDVGTMVLDVCLVIVTVVVLWRFDLLLYVASSSPSSSQ